MTRPRQHRSTRLSRITKHSAPRRFTPPPAIIYQHATTVDDRAIADRLSGLDDAHCAKSEDTDGADFSAGDDQRDAGSCSVPVPLS